MDFQLPSFADLNLLATLPALSVAAWACVLLLVDLFISDEQKDRTAWLAIGGLVFAFVANLFTYNEGGSAFMGLFSADQFTGFLNIIILLTGIGGILMSMDYLKRTGIERGEYYTLILFTVAGTMFMVGANDLMVVFVSLELMSFPLYILAAFRSPELKSEEAGFKYFVLGAFSTAFFVMGAALVYGATGTTHLAEIATAVIHAVSGEGSSVVLLLMGSGLLVVGLGFKVGVVPFHQWTPDVYEGSPTPVTAYMSVGAKIGGFAALFRIFVVALPVFMFDGDSVTVWQTLLAVIAVLTLLVGNFVGLSQTNIKRLLAYSSIAHAGYILIAVAASGTPGIGNQAAQAALIYLMAYAFTNLGAFAVVSAVEKDDATGTNISDLRGLFRSHPLLAASMAFFMLSLTGIPLTSGFIGKFLIFQSAMNAGLSALAVIGVLTSVVSAYYYLRIIVVMFLEEGEGDEAAGATPYVRWVVYLGFAGTLIFGIAPSLATNLTDLVALAAVIP